MSPTYRDNPHAILPRTVPLNDGTIDPDAALDVVRAIVPGWSAVSRATVTRIHGGITNGLSRLSAPGLDDVLVRIYGPNTDVVIDRDRENPLFARLSRESFAPPYLGRFENGRVEGFLTGFRSLEPHEMGLPRWRRGIAHRLAELHRFAPDQPVPRTFVTLRSWLEQARDLQFEGPAATAHAALHLSGALDRLSALEAYFHDTLAPASPPAAVRPVLAHNDLLAGNVMVNDTTGEVRFIDYEYGDTGFAAFDVANHFCEYAGFDSDFARGFPDTATRHDFIAAYLGTPAGIDAFDRVVRFFVLVDHLWWGSWAVVQARFSPIDFDFMGYAELRLAGLRFHTERWGPTGAGT